jgi:hypothetical protein
MIDKGYFHPWYGRGSSPEKLKNKDAKSCILAVLLCKIVR